MRIEFNPSGTHIHRDFLKVRLDFYPEPTDKTHALYYVDKPDTPYVMSSKEVLEGTSDPARYAAWWATVPKHKELNPCLCHFVVIEENTTLRELEDFIADAFGEATIASLDSYLAEPKTNPLLPSLLRYRSKLVHKRVLTKDTNGLVDAINVRLAGLEVKSGD